MVTGKLPFNSDTPVSVALKHLQEKPVPPIEIVETIPVGLNNIILKAMQKEVAERYSSSSEMYSDLQKILKSPSTVNVGGIKNMDDKMYATQKVPVIGTSNRATKNTNAEKDYMSKTKKKKNSRRQVLIRRLVYAFLAIGIITLSAFITNFILGGAYGGEDDVKVPKLVELHKSVAEETLKKLDLKMNIIAEISNSEWPKDYIIDQEYEEGYRVKKGATIDVKVSKGAKQISVPNITTMSLEAAKIELENHNLKYEVKEEPSSEVEKGDIIRQDPMYNIDVDEGDTVYIYISTGIPDGMITVPDVMMYDETLARQILTEANLIPVVEYAEKIGEPEGKILSQVPEKGSQVSELTEIVLVVNKYETTTQEPEDNTGDNSNNDKNEKPEDNKNENTGNESKDEIDYITVDLSSKGARSTFNVRVELHGDLTGNKILYEANHKRSDGKIQVPVSKNATGLLRVYIDNEIDSEMVL